MTNNKLLNYNIDYNLIEDINIDVLHQLSIIPIQNDALYILIATSNINQDTKPLMSIFKQAIKFIEVEDEYIKFELQHIKLKHTMYKDAIQASNHVNLKNENSFIIEFLDKVLKFCINNNASDIHIESLKDSVIIRIRIDGVLTQFFRFAISLYKLLSSIIKFLGNLDISQTRLPLDSRFTRFINNKNYDFRISTLPTIYGESIVLRILNNDSIKMNIDQIGFNDHTLETLKKGLALNQGMILVTGPTGSGKTTSLYSMLNYINTKEKKIITIEDPVEYKLDGIIQVNINNDIKLDYSTVLKNILRQDPDILMIGEIRDNKSLQIALQASLTGHLVIATLHTNNAIDTITRLLDLEAQPYLIASTLKLVLSQRLLRTLCPTCKIFHNESNSYKNSGCKDCNLTGYKNRKVITEILNIDPHISKLISTNSILDIKPYALKNNFQTLSTNAKNIVLDGLSSYEEYFSKVSYEI